MTSLSEQIKFEDDEAHPYGTAVVNRNTLESWARMAESTERARDRWHTVAHVFAAIIVGLLLALLWASVHLAPPAPLPTAPATNIMQLDPMTIRDRSAETIEI